MAFEVIWSAAATDDLHEVECYLQANDPRAAERWVDEIYEFVGSLASFPELGPPVKGDVMRQRRWLRCGNYRLIYRCEADEQRVYVLSLTHVSRQSPPPR